MKIKLTKNEIAIVRTALLQYSALFWETKTCDWQKENAKKMLDIDRKIWEQTKR